MINNQTNINTLFRQYHDINKQRVAAKNPKSEQVFSKKAKGIKNLIKRSMF